MSSTCGASSTSSPHTFTCGPITANTTYTLTVTLGSGANSTVTSTLTVQVAPDPASGITFASGGAIDPGSSATLSGSFCTGCTGVVDPGGLSATPASGFTLHPSPISTTTYTLTVTNQAGATSTSTVLQTVNAPSISSFDGPTSWTAGKGAIPLSASFGGNNASATVQATAGSTGSSCSPAATATSPASFSCGAITQDTTYTLTVTVGTGTNSTATATLVVKVAPTRSTTTGTMPPLFGAAIALLPNGKVLIAGGSSTADGANATDTAQIYDPSTGTFATAGTGMGCTGGNIKMSSKRFMGTATVLPSGKVLLAGGSTDGTFAHAVNAVDLYDVNAPDCFSGNSGATHLLQAARYQHTATALPNGQVLIAGGTGTASSAGLTSAELYDPAANTFSTIAGTMTARTRHTATLMNNGVVLLAGGTATAVKGDLFNYTAPTAFTQTGNSMTAIRSAHTATLLPSGAVLLAGGSSDLTAANATNSAELYSPTTTNFTALGNTMQFPRFQHTATALPAGTVLIAGGTGTGGSALSSTEVFDPTSASFSSAAAMSQQRTMGVDTFLFNGSALIAGGNTGTVAGDLFTP